jgi:hypothetical protein
MNAFATRGQPRIQPHDVAAAMLAYPLVGFSVAALERQRECQDEADLAWLLKQHGGTPNVAASRVSLLRRGRAPRRSSAPENASRASPGVAS